MADGTQAMQLDLDSLLNLIRTRRSIARMKPDPVPRELIAALLDAAVWVPNHRLTEPWQFFVIDGPARERFAAIRRDFRKSTLPTPDAPEVQPALEKLYTDTVNTPAVIVITVHQNPDPEILEEDQWATFAATYAVMLSAWSQGVGTYFRTGPLREFPPLREWLGLPDDRRIAGVLYMGYPEEIPQKRRTPAQEKTVWVSGGTGEA